MKLKKNVLLFVSSDQCHYCKRYIEDKVDGLEVLKNKLIPYKDIIEFQEIHFKSLSPNEFENKLPKQIIEKYILFYPTFILIPYDNYYNKNIIDLKGKVKGCTWDDGGKQMFYGTDTITFKSDELMDWITQDIKLTSNEKLYIMSLLFLFKYPAQNNKSIINYIPKSLLLYNILPYIIEDFKPIKLD